jgi:hypothetical protein
MAGMIKKCKVCGQEFSSPPSAGKVTCSRECKCKRRSQLLRGHKVSTDVKKKISAAAKEQDRSERLKKGTPAAMASPKAGRFETNSSARNWTIMSPSGEIYTVVNLKNWIREHKDLFDDCYTDEDVNRISNGFRVVKNNMKRGKGTVTYKGWSILYCGSKNIEKARHKENEDKL